jgi:hypothetical protein
MDTAIELIIDAAPVSDRSLRVQDDDFRRPFDLEPVGHLIADILQ